MLALTTVGNVRAGKVLARALLAERLCACVSIVPSVRSLYRWKGRIEDAAEVLLLLKTTEGCLPALSRRLAQLHPYTLPEFVVLEPSRVSKSYARWLSAETAQQGVKKTPITPGSRSNGPRG